MTVAEMLSKELEKEAVTTRKMLSIIPEEKFGWQPHTKSMDVMRLANHIAELPGWIKMVVTTDELDFAITPYKPSKNNTTEELLEFFEQNLKEGRENLTTVTEKELLKDWTLRNGDQVFDVSPKLDVIRMSISQIIHHRAQLGVFLRLLDVPIPGSYGPSADEQT